MEDLKFRGKRLDTGEWVESGSLWSFEGGELFIPVKGMEVTTAEDSEGNITGIFDTFGCKVDPETASRSTGFCDTEKRMIFGGDILEIPYEFGEGPDDSGVALYEVRWSQPDGGWNIYEGDGREEILDRLAAEMAKVVGNIWDNPDMMEGKGNA